MELTQDKINALLLNNEYLSAKLKELYDLVRRYYKITGSPYIERKQGNDTYCVFVMDCYYDRLRLVISRNDRSGWRDKKRHYRLRAKWKAERWGEIEFADQIILFEFNTFRLIMEEAIEKAEDEVFILKAEAEAIAEVI